jgi:hypothetical protein
MLIDTNKVKSLLPHMGGLVVVLGIAKLILFYCFFGINIVQYLELSESVILFFEDILFYFFALFLPLLTIILFVGHPIGQLNSEVAKRIELENNFIKRTWIFLKFYYPLTFFIALSIYSGKPNFALIVITLTIFILWQTRFVLKKYYNSGLEPTYSNIIVLIVVSIGFGYSEMKNQVKEIAHGKYKGTILHIKDKEKLVADTDMVYIGKTKDYYYLYDSTKQNAVIIPSDEVSKVELKNNSRGWWTLPE